FILTFTTLIMCGCNYLQSKDLLNQASFAYNSGDYVRAEKLVKQALELNQQNRRAKTFYAAAVRGQFLTGGNAIDNRELGLRTIKAYQELIVGESDFKELDKAYTIIAETYKVIGMNQECRQWLLKRVQLVGQKDAVRAELYYLLATLCWEESYRTTWRYYIRHSQPPAFRRSKEWQKGDVEKVKAIASEGINFIEDSLKINPKYANSYAYRELLYRELGKVAPKLIPSRGQNDLEVFQRLNREAEALKGNE
ncbi:MAG: hypothetical protein AB1489_23970, partial [Acidobacteriota bacterium]